MCGEASDDPRGGDSARHLGASAQRRYSTGRPRPGSPPPPPPLAWPPLPSFADPGGLVHNPPDPRQVVRVAVVARAANHLAARPRRGARRARIAAAAGNVAAQAAAAGALDHPRAATHHAWRPRPGVAAAGRAPGRLPSLPQRRCRRRCRRCRGHREGHRRSAVWQQAAGDHPQRRGEREGHPVGGGWPAASATAFCADSERGGGSRVGDIQGTAGPQCRWGWVGNNKQRRRRRKRTQMEPTHQNSRRGTGVRWKGGHGDRRRGHGTRWSARCSVVCIGEHGDGWRGRGCHGRRGERRDGRRKEIVATGGAGGEGSVASAGERGSVNAAGGRAGDDSHWARERRTSVVQSGRSLAPRVT